MRTKRMAAGFFLLLVCIMCFGKKSNAVEVKQPNDIEKNMDNIKEPDLSGQNTAASKAEILLDGIPIVYQFVDSIYSDSGMVNFGITGEKTRHLKENGTTYLVSDDQNGWEIKGQFWTETTSEKYKMEYANTTGFSMNLPDADYQVTVRFQNQERKAYRIASWDERGIQTKMQTVKAGGSLQQQFEVSVIDGNLKLFFIPEINASYSDAGWKQIFIESISLKMLPKRQKGSIPTLYITGDSTAHSRGSNVYPREGWGQELYRYVENGMIRSKKNLMAGNNMTPYTEYRMNSLIIQNWAYSGESTQSFWRKGRFDNLLNNIKPGDYVIIQLGHNDAVQKKLGYYTSTTTYRKNLITFVRGCQTRGASCIFLSPTPRCVFKGGKIQAAVPEYKKAMRSAANQTNSPFVDGGKEVEKYMNTVGKKTALSYYMVLNSGQYPNYPMGYSDNSHYNSSGARKAAQIIAVTLKENRMVPAQLRRLITASSDYYKGVTVDIEKVTVKKTTSAKKKKIQYTLSWKKQKNAKQYVIYRYMTATKSYKRIGTTKKTTYVVSKKWTKKQLLQKIRVKAVLSRY